MCEKEPIKDITCVWCNLPLLTGQHLIIRGTFDMEYGLPSLKPFHLFYHDLCYRDSEAQCLMEEGWRKDK